MSPELRMPYDMMTDFPSEAYPPQKNTIDFKKKYIYITKNEFIKKET